MLDRTTDRQSHSEEEYLMKRTMWLLSVLLLLDGACCMRRQSPSRI